MRGRDIKRYGYEWANLWLINTHNGVKGKLPRIKIEDYPAVKKWLDKGGVAYNGKPYKGYAQIKKRADQGDTPYNLRNCAYLEDFNKPKILWKRVGSILRFGFNNNGALGLDSTCFATGKNIEYLCCILNSPMGHYLLKNAPKTGTGDLLISVQAVEPIRIPHIEDIGNAMFADALKTQKEKEINQRVFELYGLSPKEIVYVEENFN